VVNSYPTEEGDNQI